MKPLLTFGFLFSLFVVSGQNYGNPMQQVAKDLSVQLARQKVKVLAFTRLEYAGNSNSEIGKYFSNELSFELVRQGVNYAVITTSEMEETLYEYEKQQQQKSMSQSSSSTTNQSSNSYPSNSNNNSNNEKVDWVAVGGAAALLAGLAIISKDKNPLPKVTHFVSGTIVEKGDYFEVTYTVTNKKKYKVATSRSKFLMTPDIKTMTNQTYSSPATSNSEIYLPPNNNTMVTPTTPPPSAGASWRNNTIVMEMRSCTQSGQNIECELQVTARESNVNFAIHREATVLFAAENQNEFKPFEAVIGDQSTTGYQVVKTLIAKYNAKIILRFTQVNQKIRNIAALRISCWDSASASYIAEFNSIPVY